jgi:hypothetical protein
MFKWATVTQVSPLRIRVDGDAAELPFTPDNLGGPYSVDDRVRAEIAGRSVVVYGALQAP